MQRRTHLTNHLKLGGNQKVPTRSDDANKYKYHFIEEDDTIYVSKKRTNGFAWVKFPQNKLVNYFKIQKFVHGSEYDSKIVFDYRDFLKHGMYAVYLEDQGQWNLDGGHWVDYAWTDVKNYLKKFEGIDFPNDYRTGLYLDDVELYWGATSKNGKLEVSYTLKNEDKPIFYELITQVFGKDVDLPKTFNKRITFKLKKLL
jgi:hypothetical protein